jgi:hypothetical protein
VTEEGVEILTARQEDSPGGPVAIPVAEKQEAQNGGLAGKNKAETAA